MNILQKWAMKATPEAFRVFIPYVSPSSLHVVHGTEVLKKAVEIARNTMAGPKQEPSSNFSPEMKASLKSAGIQLSVALPGPSLGSRLRLDSFAGLSAGLSADLSAGLTAETRREIGRRILIVYFTTLKYSTFYYLDLQLEHFHWSETDQTLTFSPSNFGFVPSEDFREKLLKLYHGFYFNDSQATSAGVSLYAWKTKVKDGFSGRMETLLRKHFGESLNQAQNETLVSFSIEHFKSSFHAVFEEAQSSDAKFHPELTFVGVMLVTLYLSLEALGEKYPVNEVYYSIFQREEN